MFEILITTLSLAGFAFVVAAAARLGAGSSDSLAGMLASPTMPPRPRGVQEDDLPRFVFRDADAAGAMPA